MVASVQNCCSLPANNTPHKWACRSIDWRVHNVMRCLLLNFDRHSCFLTADVTRILSQGARQTCSQNQAEITKISTSDSHSSQWEKAKLHLSPHPHPLTDSHQILHTWLRPPYLPTCHIRSRLPRGYSPHIAKFTTQIFLCTQILSTDLSARPLNRFWHAIHQQTCIDAG